MKEHDGCKGCKYEHCSPESKECQGCKQNAVDKYTKMTQADRIRSMSDEELAVCLYEIGYYGGWLTPKCAIEWLQQPPKEG